MDLCALTPAKYYALKMFKLVCINIYVHNGGKVGTALLYSCRFQVVHCNRCVIFEFNDIVCLKYNNIDSGVARGGAEGVAVPPEMLRKFKNYLNGL